MDQMALIPRVEEGEIIPQRIGDGYISATALCQSVGKRFSDYRIFIGRILRKLGVDCMPQI